MAVTAQVRLEAWSQNYNTKAIVVSDRLLGPTSIGVSVGNPVTHNSLWDEAPDGWEGGIVYNDNHVEYSQTSDVENVGYRFGTNYNEDNMLAPSSNADPRQIANWHSAVFQN